MLTRLLVLFAAAAIGVPASHGQLSKAALGASADATVLDSSRADADMRARLAEEIVGSKETPGREFEARYRAMLVKSLKRLTFEELQTRRATGLLVTPNALGSSSSDLTYTPLSAPCRIIDTRSGGGALTGGAPGPTRSFMVAGSVNLSPQGGSSTGCGVPVGATAVLINFVAVNPLALGNLRGAAFPNSVPATGSILNYQALNPVLNIANGLLFPICDPTVSTCTYDITLLANGGATDVVADVLGYAMKFSKQEVESFTTTQQTAPAGAAAVVPAFPSCGNASSVTVVAPVAGRAHVRANAIVNWQHTSGVANNVAAVVSQTAANCTTGLQALSQDYAFDPPHPTGSFNVTLRPDATFDVSAGPTTFYLNDFSGNQGTDTQTVLWVGWIVTFEPN